MSSPIEIMDEIGCYIRADSKVLLIFPDEWQSLRAAIEAQAEELAQARARIGRLEAGVVLAIHSLRDHWQAGGTTLLVASGLQDIVNESEPQSLAAVRAEVLREASELFSGIDHPATEEEDVLSVQRVVSDLLNEADRIEREAKESR